MLDALVSPAMAGDVFAVAACAPPARKQRDRSAERSRHRLGTREARRLVGSRMDRMAFLELLARHGGPAVCGLLAMPACLPCPTRVATW